MGSALVVGLLLFFIGNIAIVVVISLIPVYLEVADISVHRPDAGRNNCYSLKMNIFSLSSLASFLLIYETNSSSIDLSWVSDTDKLSTEVGYSSSFGCALISFVYLSS